MKATFLVIGWALFGVAAFCAVAMHRTDRRMQAFRAPGTRPNAFLLVPVRWKRELYTPEGQELVAKAWGYMWLMYAAGVGGMILLSLGVDALP